MQITLVGAGAMGFRVAEELLASAPEIELIAIDVSENSLAKFQSALGDDRVGPTDLHELLKREFEGFLVAVCLNRAGCVLRICQRLQPALPHACSLGLGGKILFPVAKAV